MKIKFTSSLLLTTMLVITSIHNSFSQTASHTLLIETSKGNIKCILYEQTPMHADNFIKLVNDGFYNGVLFHRVIKYFMIQTGDPDSKNVKKGASSGSGGPGYTVPAEFHPDLYHKKGALAAARPDGEFRVPHQVHP